MKKAIYCTITPETLRGTAVQRWYNDQMGNLGGLGLVIQEKEKFDALGQDATKHQLEQAGLDKGWFYLKCAGCDEKFEIGLSLCYKDPYGDLIDLHGNKHSRLVDLCHSCISKLHSECMMLRQEYVD